MTATFIFAKNVNLSFEFCMRCYCTRMCKNLSSLDFCSLNTTEKNTDVVASFSKVKHLSEHFNACNNNFLLFMCKTNDFNFFANLKHTAFNSTSCNSTTACDCEYVFYRHDEWLVNISLWFRDVFVDCVHKFKDSVAPFAVRILKSLVS